MNRRFLIFVEDPGAVNMILDLPEFFANKNITFDIIANKHASKILNFRNIPHLNLINIDQIENFLENKSYSYFLIGTSENIESLGLNIIDIGKRKKIRTIGMVDMLVNSFSRFKGNSENPLNHKPDYLIVTDEFTKNAFTDLGMDKAHIFVCRHPQKDRIKNLKSEFKKKFPPKELAKKRWLFISENIDLFNPLESYRTEDYTFEGRGTTDWRTGIIIEELIDILKIISPQNKLEVRLHPKNQEEQFNFWKDEIIFDKIQDPLESVWKADFVLGMSSNLLVEASYLDKNVLSILPRHKEKEWMHELKNNIIPIVFNREDLKTKLVYLSNLKKNQEENFKEDSKNIEQIYSNMQDLLISF